MALDPPHPARGAGEPLTAARAPLALLQRWWFWAGLLALLWAFPLLKSLSADLPARLPGEQGPPLDLALPDEQAGTLRLSDLRGRVLVLTELPLAEANARDTTWERLVRLRKRLRGLDQVLHYVVLAQGGDAADLSGWLEQHRAPRPELHFGLDEGGAAAARLGGLARAPSAEFFLIDRHGRIRGAYGGSPPEIDRLVEDAGHLANWSGQDLQPSQ